MLEYHWRGWVIMATIVCWWLLKIELSLSLKACPNPLKNGPKPLAKLYSSPKNSRGQRRLHSYLCHPPTRLVLFLAATSILPSLQAYAELHALSPLCRSISPWNCRLAERIQTLDLSSNFASVQCIQCL